MTMLVLGATGLLGQAFVAEARARGVPVRSAARKGAEIELDIGDAVALSTVLQSERPTMIVNCAALVNVAACEADPGLAYRINAAPLFTLAQWCRTSGAKLIHVSTDHLFAGEGPVAHDEGAPVTLFNHYAATKLAGEHFAALSPDALMLRTSIVGLRGWDEPSFAEWAIDAVANDRPMTLFADAFTSSIDTAAFATAAMDLAEAGASGLLNLAASEVYTKEAFVRQLADELAVRLTNATVGSVAALNPPRPKSLGLDVTRAQAHLDEPLPTLAQVARALILAYRSKT